MSAEQSAELSALINSCAGLFGDTPSRTHFIEHDIEVGNVQPIRQRFYRVSEEKLKVMDKESQYMIENSIPEPSSSSLASPCLGVEV